jgi:hypothetical protein
MNAGHACAGCTAPAQSFDCVVAGNRVRLCARCAGRLLAGESKGAVIRSVNKMKEAA